MSSARWIMTTQFPTWAQGGCQSRREGRTAPLFSTRALSQTGCSEIQSCTCTGNRAPLSNGAKKSRGRICTLTWALYPSQFPSLKLQKHHCTEIFTHLWNTISGHWCTVGYSLCRCTDGCALGTRIPTQAWVISFPPFPCKLGIIYNQWIR